MALAKWKLDTPRIPPQYSRIDLAKAASGECLWPSCPSCVPLVFCPILLLGREKCSKFERDGSCKAEFWNVIKVMASFFLVTWKSFHESITFSISIWLFGCLTHESLYHNIEQHRSAWFSQVTIYRYHLQYYIHRWTSGTISISAPLGVSEGGPV